MQALRFSAGELALRDVPKPSVGEGEALVRVRMAGICATDLEIVRGYMAYEGTLGHEFVGEVEACSDAALVGKRVAGEINLSCGDCGECRAGRARHCTERSVLGILGHDGCFAQYTTLPAGNLHVLPDTLSDEAACFVEPTAAAFEILEQVDVDAHDEVVVIGDGKLGLLITQVLAQHGADVTVVGRHAHKLALAQRCGAKTAKLADVAPKSWGVVVEATGSAGGMEAALSLVRPRGTIVLKSTYADRLQLDASPFVIDEITLVGSRCGPFEPAVRALADGRVDPLPMIVATHALAEGVAAMAEANTPGTLKVLLDMR